MAGKKITEIKQVHNPLNQTIEFKADSIEIRFAAPRMHRIMDDVELLLKEIAEHDVIITNLVYLTATTDGTMKMDIKQSESLTNFYIDKMKQAKGT